MGNQAECTRCGWVGGAYENFADAEAEAKSHDCKKLGLDELSCAEGCVAGSRIVGGVWVDCKGCK